MYIFILSGFFVCSPVLVLSQSCPWGSDLASTRCWHYRCAPPHPACSPMFTHLPSHFSAITSLHLLCVRPHSMSVLSLGSFPSHLCTNPLPASRISGWQWKDDSCIRISQQERLCFNTQGLFPLLPLMFNAKLFTEFSFWTFLLNYKLTKVK